MRSETKPTEILRIDRQAQQAIAASPYLKPWKLTVHRECSGCLTLRGQVNSYFAKQMAQETLRSIQGVVEIDNQLDVVWS